MPILFEAGGLHLGMAHVLDGEPASTSQSSVREFAGGSSTATASASKNTVQAAEQDRQCDGGQEGDHNKGDRHSIRRFLIVVDTHRTSLLFAEATKQISLGCRRAADPTARQQCAKHSSTVRCAALA
jgi:hypothetical protein